MVELKELRLRRGLTTRDLARRAGVAESTVYRAERGKTTPRPHVARRLGAVLGVAPSEVVELWPAAEPSAGRSRARGVSALLR